MFDEPPTTHELLHAWRDATRAADLAERLASAAAKAADQAEISAEAAEEVAALAEQTAAAAIAAADRASRAAQEARRVAVAKRQAELPDADNVSADVRMTEGEARDAYHRAEDDDRARRRANPN